MAIIKTIVTERNVIYTDQYCRVENATVTKNEMRYSIGVYFDKAASETMPPHRAEEFVAPFDLFSTANVWQQAYADIKQIWPDAIDEI